MFLTKDALKIIDRMIGDDAELRRMNDQETINAEVASMIDHARTRAGLTQKQLADLVGTKQPVIASLEDADYDGHSLSMLTRIAAALNARVELRLVPARSKLKTA
ncbi:MAG: XRE family transcriptional regulator [Acidobacteria bacterium]|nr:XRE family transcriptional regulator [Acidobacteriota bacterium]